MSHLPFSLSIAVVSLLQGATVAVAGPPDLRLRWRRRLLPLALLPALSIVAFVAGLQLAPQGARILAYLAVAAVPPLAAFAFAFLVPGARRPLALLAPLCLALAWLDGEGFFGEIAALLLIAGSCVTLGSLLALLTPPLALGGGLVAMACADTALIVAEQLQRPNVLLERAAPALGLPQLQAGVFGSAVIGYGDVFAAATLGALTTVALGGRRRLRAALATAAFALCFDLLFFFVSELPATVPVAAAFLVAVLPALRNREGRLGVKEADVAKGCQAEAPGLR